MLKQGTYCYVVPSCRASPAARSAVGRIVEVIGGPYQLLKAAPDAGACYDVRYRGQVFYCTARKLRPINDPDIDVGERATTH